MFLLPIVDQDPPDPQPEHSRHVASQPWHLLDLSEGLTTPGDDRAPVPELVTNTEHQSVMTPNTLHQLTSIQPPPPCPGHHEPLLQEDQTAVEDEWSGVCPSLLPALGRINM